MATQRRWLQAGPYELMGNGTTQGVLTLSAAFGLYVGQKIHIVDPNPNIPGQLLEIKKITGINTGDLNSFPSIEVGPIGSSTTTRSDVSLFGINSTIFAVEQLRSDIPLQEIERAIYAEEPSVARRSLIVDSFGQPTSTINPFPVALFGQQITILNNLLAMQANNVSPGNFIVNNEGFFVFDNEGNFIQQG